jgi:hypothetical protein
VFVKRTIREYAYPYLDGSGNVNLLYPVRLLEDMSEYDSSLAIPYEEVRVEKFNIKFIPNSYFKYAEVNFGPVMLTTFHRELPASMSMASLINYQATKTHPPLKDTYSITWHFQRSSPLECEFVSARGNSTTHYIPLTLGGITMYIDGPSSEAGKYVGTVIREYTVLFRGLRTSTLLTLEPTMSVNHVNSESIEDEVPDLVPSTPSHVGGRDYVILSNPRMRRQ